LELLIKDKSIWASQVDRKGPIMNNLFYLFDQININLLDSWWLSILVGVLLCFFGFKIFNKSVFWFGVLFGGVVGYGIGSDLFQLIGGIAGAIVLGLICGYLLRAVLRIGIFLGGLFIGGVVGTNFLGHSLWVIPIIIGSGIFAAIFFKYFIMLATALWGAILLTDSLVGLTHFSVNEYPIAIITIELVVFIGGLAYQFLHGKKGLKFSDAEKGR